MGLIQGTPFQPNTFESGMSAAPGFAQQLLAMGLGIDGLMDSGIFG